MIKLLTRSKNETEEDRQEVVRTILAPHLEEANAVAKYMRDRNDMFQSQGMGRPNSEVCERCAADLQRSNEALVETIAYDRKGVAKLKSWLGDSANDQLIERLSRMEHTYRTDEREGEPNDAVVLLPGQRVRTYMLLEALTNSQFIKEVGDIIERNPRDGKSELSGLIVPDSAKMRLGLFETGKSGNQSCSWSARTLKQVPHIALFHLHALYDDCTKYASPSFGCEETDFGDSNRVASCTGESHGVVFTKLEGRMFNADYYSHQKIVRGKRIFSQPAIVDLGNYEY